MRPMAKPTYSRRRLIGITVILVMTGVVLVTNQSQYHLETVLFKVNPDGSRTELEDGSGINDGDQLVMHVTSTSPLYIHVYSEDSQGDAHGLFPLASSGLKNPVPGHNTYALPGDELTWTVHSAATFKIIHILASPEPDNRVDAAYAALPAPHLVDVAVAATPLIDLSREIAETAEMIKGASHRVIELATKVD